MRYLIGTKDTYLEYSRNNKPLYDYCDVDWGNNIDIERSTTKYAYIYIKHLRNNLVKQAPTEIIPSLIEAEQVVTRVTKEVVWLHQSFKDLYQRHKYYPLSNATIRYA
jgi:hypothetical protein